MRMKEIEIRIFKVLLLEQIHRDDHDRRLRAYPNRKNMVIVGGPRFESWLRHYLRGESEACSPL